MITLTAFPNWDREITTRFVTQTKIAESIAGKEHRAGLMPRPAVYQSFTPTNLTAALTQKFVDWRDQRGALPVAMPIWFDALYLPVPVEAGATSISIAARYRLFQWFKYAIILSNSDYYDIIQIRKPINYNDRILLEEEPRRRFDTGAFLCPLAFGKMMLPEQWYHNPKVTELVIDFEERLGIDANLIRYKNGHFAGAQYYPRSGNPDWPGGGGGFWDVETPPSPIEGDPGDGTEPVEPQKSTDIYPIKNAGDPIEEDPDAPGGSDNPNPDDVGEPGDPENPDNPAKNPASEFFINTGDKDPIFNLWAGAAVVAASQGWAPIQNPTSLLMYKAEPPEGCFQIMAEDCFLAIVAAVKLVLKSGASPEEVSQNTYRDVVVKCSGFADQTIRCNLDVVRYAVFQSPVPLELGDYEAMNEYFYNDGEAWCREAKRILKMPSFEGMRYAFYPRLKSVINPMGWQLTESATQLWAGTATLGEIES